MAKSTTTIESPPNVQHSASQTGENRPSVKRPIGLVVPTLVLIVYWIVTEASYRIEMGMFYRFVTRIAVLLAMVLFFLGWGFTRRHFTFGQRCLAFAMIVGPMLLAGALSHPATGTFATAMMGLPIVISLSVAWLWLTRPAQPVHARQAWVQNREVARALPHDDAREPSTTRETPTDSKPMPDAREPAVPVGAASVVVFSVVAMLRWDGMDGRQRTELSWRWTPNGEERFLQQGVLRTSVPAEDQRPVLEGTAADWSSFRGGNRESVVRGIELRDWTKSPPREIWRRRVGPGWSSVIAVGDFLFTQEQRGDRESVVCYHANTGQEVWVHTPKESTDRFDDTLSGTGPRATPTFHGSRIYSYGAKGQMECLDAASGVPYWSQSLFTMTGTKTPQWGSASSPVVVDDFVVAFTGGQQNNSLLALDLLSGRVRWQSPGGATSYSSPQVMTIAGERLIVMHDDEGLNGVRIEDGKLLFKHQSPYAASFQPMLQPHLVEKDRLIVNWDSGLLCLQVHREGEPWKLQELWTSNRLKPSFNDFAIHDGYIYGLDDGIFCCVDAANGKRLWKGGRYGFGQLLLLPEIDELLVLTEHGDVVRVAADPKAHRELGQFKAIEGKTWNHPLLTHGRLIVRNAEEMACFEVWQPVELHAARNWIR